VLDERCGSNAGDSPITRRTSTTHRITGYVFRDRKILNQKATANRPPLPIQRHESGEYQLFNRRIRPHRPVPATCPVIRHQWLREQAIQAVDQTRPPLRPTIQTRWQTSMFGHASRKSLITISNQARGNRDRRPRCSCFNCTLRAASMNHCLMAYCPCQLVWA